MARIEAAVETLRSRRIGLLVWDGWRSLQLQRRLWDEYRRLLAERSELSGEQLDARVGEFVAPPDSNAIEPAHLTGGAVDLTLCSAVGNPLEMGGEFDELTDRSHPEFYEREGLGQTEAEFRDRRRMLAEAMASAGFWRLPTEWWHFEFGTPSWASATGLTPLFEPVFSA